MMDADTKENAQKRLNRIAGQVAGIQRMVEEDRYCVDVLGQITAVRSALAKVSGLLLEAHLHTCVSDAFDSRDKKKRNAKIDELVSVFDRACK